MIALFSLVMIVGFSVTLSSDEAFSLRNLDYDHDGVLDEDDECPNVKETYNKFQDTDGCPDSISEEVTQYQFPDSDGDGYEDRIDSCINLPETWNGYLDFDGCPEIIPYQLENVKDSDSDTIPDSIDVCPLEKESFNEFKDGDGCPDSLVPISESSKNLSFTNNQCLDGKIQVLRINSENPICVYLDIAQRWEKLGIGEIISKSTPNEDNPIELSTEIIEKPLELTNPKNKLEVIHITGNISMLIGIDPSLEGNIGGNIGVSSGPDGLLIIDDGFAFALDDIKTQLIELKTCATCDNVEFLLNTHWHADHVANNAYFGERDTIIIAHSNVRELLSNPQEIKAFGMKFDAYPKEALPVVTFDESVFLHFNDEKIQVIHLPNGHTNSDSIVYFTESNVLHLGDHFFNGRFPFVDLEHGGSVQGLTKNVEKIIDEFPENTIIIPGHGPLTNMENLKDYHVMLVDTTKIVQDQLEAGKTLEEIQDVGLPEAWQKWDSVWIDEATWIQIVYTSLSLN